MIKKTTYITQFVFVFVLLFSVSLSAQELLDIGEKSASDTLIVISKRPKNAISIGVGSTLLNDDFNMPDYENFLKFQLKHFFNSSIAVSGNLKKFDIENYDFDENGFLSGDLNVEWYLFPKKKFTPFIYAGPGLLISNDFDDKNYKVQGGLGLDLLIGDYFGIYASVEANYIYDEQVGSQLFQEADGLYYNATIGIQFYFGNRNTSKPKISKKTKTIKQESTIDSNWIGRINKNK